MIPMAHCDQGPPPDPVATPVKHEPSGPMTIGGQHSESREYGSIGRTTGGSIKTAPGHGYIDGSITNTLHGAQLSQRGMKE